MSDAAGGRRGLGIALLAVGLGATGAALYARRGLERPTTELVPRSAAMAARAEAAVNGVAKALEPTAAAAARVRELLAAFDTGVDAATFQDALESEDWWREFRAEGQASAIVAGDQPLASLFVEQPAPPLGALAARARQDRVASGLVPGRGRVYAVSAARIERSSRAAQLGAVAVIGRPVDPSALAAAATTLGSAVALSDGQRVLLAGGPAAATTALASAVGREAAGPVTLEDGSSALPVALAPGLWLWTLAPPSAPAGAPGAVPIALFGVAIAATAGGLLTLRSRGPAAAEVGAIPMKPTGVSSTHVSDAVAPPPSELIATGGGSGSSVPLDVRPQVLGRYSLVEKIGEGGMAEVFRATLFGAEGFERRLVVKRLLPMLAGNKDAIAQFIDEARLQATLSHSNIVQVFDFGRAGQDYFLALEYIDGRDFEKVVERHIELNGRALDLSLAASIVHDVLSALEYAHTRSDANGRPLEIVHRDVSLSNVLLSYEGEVKLSDFGIAKAERRVSRTEVGMVKGNASYMAPEQARGEPVDARADVFATGVVLFSAVTGQPLYQGDGNQLLRAAVGPGTQQFESVDRLSPELASIIMRAIEPVPAKRFSSAGEFARALRPFATASRHEVALLMRSLFEQDRRGGAGERGYGNALT